MKTFLVAIAALLLNTISTAQTISALTDTKGLILTVSNRVTPPVNVVPYDELTAVTTLVLLDEKTMKTETGIEVSSFAMTTDISGIKNTLKTIGGELSKEMKSELLKLKSGDKVYFEYIKGKLSDSTVRALTSMAFQVR